MLKGKIINKTIIYNLLDTQFITNWNNIKSLPTLDIVFNQTN